MQVKDYHHRMIDISAAAVNVSTNTEKSYPEQQI